MRRLIVSEFVTLDGVMEDPGGGEDFDSGGWSFRFPDAEGMRFKLDELMACDAMLLGRRTYEGFAAVWPGRADDIGFSERMNTLPKYVVSSTMRELTWSNSHLLAGDAAAAVSELKRTDGGDILLAGSRTLLEALVEGDLVDEYRLMIHPIILGAGKRLFGAVGELRPLRLTACRPLDSGTVIATYEPLRG